MINTCISPITILLLGFVIGVIYTHFTWDEVKEIEKLSYKE